MKKKLFYLASICIGLAFAACSSDDGGSNPPDPTLTGALLTHTDDAVTLKDLKSIGAPFEEIVLSETGRAIVGPISAPTSEGKRRVSSGGTKYIVGTYSVSGAVYTIYNPDGSVYCTLKFVTKEAKKATVKISLVSAAEGEAVEYDGEVAVSEKIAADAATQALCREWVISSARLRHTDGVTAVKHFETTAEAASLNAILDYAQSVASIDEKFDDDMSITSIEFTTDGTFIIFFKNKDNYIGKWEWVDKSKGYIKYVWNDEDMGNKFEDGEGVFDIRKFQKQSYYTLTFSAKVESTKTYKVELSFYMNEKTK